MMKRVTWFAGGVVAGLASAGYAKKKVKATASQVAPAHIARSAAITVRSKTVDEAHRAGGRSCETFPEQTRSP